jgi:hypothetical protein
MQVPKSLICLRHNRDVRTSSLRSGEKVRGPLRRDIHVCRTYDGGRASRHHTGSIACVSEPAAEVNIHDDTEAIMRRTPRKICRTMASE